MMTAKSTQVNSRRALKLHRWLERVSRRLTWTNLGRLGKSKILKTSYLWLLLVPISAKAIAAINHESHSSILSQAMALDFSLPFSWKLLYFAAVAIAAADAIYELRCPKIIRQFKDYTSFCASKASDREISCAFASWWSQSALRNGAPGDEDRKFLSLFLEYCQLSTSPDVVIEKIRTSEDGGWNDLRQLTAPADMAAGLFGFVREVLDQKRTLSRLFCCTAYTAAFVLLLIIVIQNCAYVIKQ